MLKRLMITHNIKALRENIFVTTLFISLRNTKVDHKQKNVPKGEKCHTLQMWLMNYNRSHFFKS